MNSQTFIDDALTRILNSHQYQEAKNQKQSFILHMDNSKVHRSKKVNSFLAATGLKIAAHPPYSPDMAPSDFNLFGKLKRKIAGMEFASEEELLSEIITQFDAIEKAELEKVFSEWESRLEMCISCQGNFFEND